MICNRVHHPIAFITIAGMVLMGGLTASKLSAQNTDDLGWKPIFDGKTMGGWYTYQNQAGKNADNGVFKIENGAFHILDLPAGTTGVETNGCLLTNDEYSHVRLRVQYKWGTKQFARAGRAGAPAGATTVPRKRDAGLLYYYFGEDRIWGNNMELQIQEGDTGDMWVNGNISFVTNVVDPQAPAPLRWALTGGSPATIMGNLNPPAKNMTSPAPGAGRTNEYRRVLKYPDWEDISTWNTVEAVLDGQHIQHFVNGHLVMDGRDAKRRDLNNPEKWIPLTSGKVCLEAEGAEVWYRNIQVKPITKGSTTK
jgi:hypothetical protein